MPQTNVAVTGTRTLQFDSNSELDPPSHTSLSIGIPDSAAALPLATGTLSLDGDPQPLGSWQHDQANVKIPQGSSDYRRGTADPQPTVTDRDVRGSTMELVSAAGGRPVFMYFQTTEARHEAGSWNPRANLCVCMYV